jgi:dTDP-6-deoxy-L-talose 4-dehydrogenase (NAD+)
MERNIVSSRVLVTGGTGFVGAPVVDELLRRGALVTLLCRDAARAARWRGNPSLRVQTGDIADLPGAVLDDFAGHGRVLHLAWECLGAFKDAAHENEVLPRHLAFLAALLERGAKRLFVAGTCLEYGLKEGPLAEDTPCEPVTAYGRAKDALRRALEPLCAGRGALLTWGRLFYMYGPGQAEKSLLSQLDRAIATGATVFNMSGGRQWRDYLPVSEVARRIVAVATQDRVTGVVNCASGKPVSVLDLVQAHLRERGADIRLNLGHYPYPDYEPFRFWADTARLEGILGSAG